MTTKIKASHTSVHNSKIPAGQVSFIVGSFLVGFLISLTLLYNQIDSQVFHEGTRSNAQPALNVWFDSNAPLVYLAMTATNTTMQMTNRHPLFPYVGVLPVKAMWLLGVPEPVGVCLVLAFGVGLMCGLFALILVLTIESIALIWLSQLLFLASSSFVFWSGICERFPLGSATILSVTAGAAYYSKKKSMPVAAAVVLNVMSLSVTLTNWMFGLLLTWNFFKIKAAVKVSLYALSITLILWFMEQLFIEQRNSLLYVDSWNQKFILGSYAGGVYQKFVALLGHTVVIPSIHLYGFADGATAESHQMLGVAHSPPGSGSLLGLLLVIAWSLLLIAGVLSWWFKTEKNKFDHFLSLAILGQISLHMIYGAELFLYGLHIVPLVFLLVARGLNELKGSARHILIPSLCVFVPLLAFHNITGYTEARTLYLERYEERLHSSALSASADETKNESGLKPPSRLSESPSHTGTERLTREPVVQPLRAPD